jgi:hypothetical protein
LTEFADIAHFNKFMCDGYSSYEGDGLLDLIIVPAAYAGAVFRPSKTLPPADNPETIKNVPGRLPGHALSLL